MAQMKPGTLIILNDMDSPQADLIAVVMNPTQAQYISERQEHWNPVGIADVATPIEFFGVGVDFTLGRMITRVLHPGYATYTDGRPRHWQQEFSYSCNLSMRGIKLICALQDEGYKIQ